MDKTLTGILNLRKMMGGCHCDVCHRIRGEPPQTTLEYRVAELEAKVAALESAQRDGK